MRFFLFITLFSCAAFAYAGDAAKADEVRVGDSTAAVKSHLGEPDLEFPLDGQWILDYGNCVVVSRGGVVTSIRKRSTEVPPETTGKVDPAAPTIKGLLAKARKGDAESQYCLAYCYHVGNVVSNNMDEAIRWYTFAAMQGHMAAQHNLAVIYMEGQGVSIDYEQAYTWAVLAEGNGNGAVARLLRPRLSDEEEHGGFARARRITLGLEESPYGTPDSSVIVANQESDSVKPTAD